MADAFIVNYVPTSYGDFIKKKWDAMIAAGAVCKGSGDGLSSYNATGYCFTSFAGGSTANSTANPKAWTRFQTPDGNREWCEQVDNSGGIRTKYTPNANTAPLTGGSPSATVCPSATLEKFYGGGGSDASPTYKTSYIPSGVTTSGAIMQGGFRGGSPYGWWLACGLISGTTTQFGQMFDPVSGDAADNDPYVHYVSRNALSVGCFTGTDLTTIQGVPGANIDGVACFMDTATTAWTQTAAGIYSYNGQLVSGGGGNSVNPFNGSDNDMDPIRYERPSASGGAVGKKGFSNNMRWTSTQRTNFVDTLQSKGWICVGGVWLFWDGASSPHQ